MEANTKIPLNNTVVFFQNRRFFMHTKEEILSYLKELLKTKCSVEGPVYLDDHLSENLHLDSMGLLTLATEIENHYEIFLQEQETPPETIGDVIDLILLRLKEKKQEERSLF